MSVRDLYAKVSDNIIREIEAGNLPPWLQPWKSGKHGGIIPINAVTKKSYNGLNVLLLWAERQEKQYPLAEWLTYKQCQEAGGQVRKGEKSTPGIYKQVIEKGTDEERLVPFMRTFSLFNVAQCDGLPESEPVADLPEHKRNEQAEAFFSATGAEVRWGEPMAAYIPSRDLIVMPERGAFTDAESMYATWAHEATHWIGHKTRLDRDLKSRFDRDAYAFEELVAEIGAAMACAHLQVKGELRHASYVDHWLKVLKQDSRAILSAASMASKSCGLPSLFLRRKAGGSGMRMNRAYVKRLENLILRLDCTLSDLDAERATANLGGTCPCSASWPTRSAPAGTQWRRLEGRLALFFIGEALCVLALRVRPSVRLRNSELSALLATTMTTFSYSITDLSHYESDLIEVTWESEDEAVDFGGTIAREMLEQMPELCRRGWCITIRDSERGRVSIVPIGELSS